MNDALGFALLGVVILCAIVSPLAVRRSFKRDRLLPGIFGGLLAATAIACSLPFSDTYEAAWLPEATIAYFTAMAFLSLALLPASPRTDVEQAAGERPRKRFSMAMRLGFTAAFLLCCAFLWNRYDERSQKREAGNAAWQFLTSMGTNINFGNGGYNVVSFSHPELITDEDVKVVFVPELQFGRLKISAVDLTGTKVTEAGVRLISAALPGCEIRL